MNEEMPIDKMPTEEEIEDIESRQQVVEFNTIKSLLDELLNKKKLTREDKKALAKILESDPLEIKKIKSTIEPERDFKKIDETLEKRKELGELVLCLKKPTIEGVEERKKIVEEIKKAKIEIIEIAKRLEGKIKMLLEDESIEFDIEDEKESVSKEIKEFENNIEELKIKLGQIKNSAEIKRNELEEYLNLISDDEIKKGAGLKAKREIERLHNEITIIEKFKEELSDEKED